MIGLSDDTGTGPPAHDFAPEFTAKTFAEGGWLEAHLGLDYRPQQDSMARAVSSAFTEDASLLFEAGTGVGKSLAYLIPGIIRAVDQRRPFVVSTHTISLQEQIETQDLPMCRRYFAKEPKLEAYVGFKSAVLLGKSNYLCTTRLAHALADRASLFADDEYSELQRIADWSEVTEAGLRHELQPPPRPEVWEAVNADSSSCARKYCDCNRCFYQRARARIREANVIVVNHALLFALISAGGARSEEAGSAGRGVLFPDDFVVLDEAHTVPEVATAHFGLSISSYGIERTLKHLYNPRSKRGLLRKHGGSGAPALVAEALSGAKQFFEGVETRLLTPRPVVRLREADSALNPLEGPLDSLQKLVGHAADRLEDGRERDELLEEKASLSGIQASLTEWQTLGDQGHVYWAERGGRKQTIVTLKSAPIDIAPELRRHLFGREVSVVCTSATLAVANEMAPFAARIGAESARVGIVKSPFDYEKAMRVYVASDVPLPSPQEAKLAINVLTDYIKFCTLKVRGGSLVLFTSYSDLRAVAAALDPVYREAGRPLLLQGDTLSRTELARQMRSLGNAILFGTDSFWTGVDVPGDALAQVIITRLPFDPPDHPVAEAQAERVREQGGNPFSELTLPEALVKFRQGVGRLIRKQTDRGLITILDSRVLAKAYGRLFLESLPQPEFARITRETREDQFVPFQ